MNKILLTRPRLSSERWASLLSARGFDAEIEPLLVIEPTGTKRPAGDFQAVLLTSANAPDALEMMKASVGNLFTLPCFCVGASSASAARAVGFTHIIPGASDSAAMARLVIDTLANKTRPLLHIAGDIVDGKARTFLESHGFTLQSWAIYRAIAVEDLSPSLIVSLKAGEITLLPVFSPRSARILVSLIEKNRLTGVCAGITAVGLSQAVADVLQNLPWRRLRIAAAPSEDEMLACLQTEVTAMTEKETPALPLPPAKKKSRLGWVLLGLVLIAGAGAAKFYPWQRILPDQTLEAPVLETPMEKPVAAIVPVQQPEEVTPLAPAHDDVGALKDKIAALEMQVAQLQSKNANPIAAFAAFADMREAAQQGRNIAVPLAKFHAVTKDDAALTAQTAILDSYKDGAPTLAQLRANLGAQESHIAVPETEDASTSIWGRLQKIMRPLISVRPLHDPQFTNLESALDNNDAAAAVSAFNALPSAVQQSLSAWGAQLQARAAIDQALSAIDAHFTGGPNLAADKVFAKDPP